MIDDKFKEEISANLNYTLEELRFALIDLMEEITSDLENPNQSKRAAQRVRVKSILLSKLFKKFRKISPRRSTTHNENNDSLL